MTNQSPAEALRLLHRKFNLALMANYPGTTASNQFLDDLLSIVTAYAATVEREADTEGRINELKMLITIGKTVGMMQSLTVDMRYLNDRLAALQGPIQGDSNTSEEASSTQ